MNRIQLIAETPRAGQWNHCFIVAPTGDLSGEEVIREVLTAARHCPQGEDYLAVSVEAAQMLSGRTGTEILVLTGIEVNRLSDTQRQQVMAQLERRLADLATLVTEKVDWEQEGKGGLVKRVELVDWENDFSNLPPAKKRRLSQSERKRRTNQLMWAGSIIGILLVGIAIWSLKNPDNTSEQPMETKSPQVTPTGDTKPEAEAEAKRKQAEAEAKRKQAEAEAKRKQAEAKRKQAEAKRKQAEEAAKRKQAEETKQKQAEADTKRKQREVAEQELQKLITKYHAKVSNVGCQLKPETRKNCENKKTVSILCGDDLLGYVKNYKSKELSSQITKWCSQKKKFPDDISKELDYCLSNVNEITPVIEFFQQLSTQLNKETLCPNQYGGSL